MGGASGIDYIGTYFNAYDADRSLDMNGSGPGSVYQSFATVIGQTYTVSFYMAGNPAIELGDKPLQVTVAGYSNVFHFDTTGHSLPNIGPWDYDSFSFLATAASSTLTFTSLATGPCGPALDKVEVVPLPPTVLLLGSGLLGLGLLRLRQRRQA